MNLKFENDQKNFGCVGSCGYAPDSVNSVLPSYCCTRELMKNCESTGLKTAKACVRLFGKSVPYSLPSVLLEIAPKVP